MKVTIAQLNPTVGDLKGNLKKARKTIQDSSGKTDLIIFPELFLTGYPPRDLLENKAFLKAIARTHDELLEYTSKYPDILLLMGTIMQQHGSVSQGLYNSALLLQNGKIIGGQNKSALPSYDVFDETRHFLSSDQHLVFLIKGVKVGVTICEDMWSQHLRNQRDYMCDPVKRLVDQGAELIINLSASPFSLAKELTRYEIVSNIAKEYGVAAVHVNQVGANDELVFDGRSYIVNSSSELLHVGASFKEEVVTIDLQSCRTIDYKPLDELSSCMDALCLGVEDYFRKCGFKKAVLGLSGGIDSALCAVIAARALGPENVLGVMMPSKISSAESVSDSEELIKRLGIRSMTIPISSVFDEFRGVLQSTYKSIDESIAYENLQARIRGNLLMSISNHENYLLLSTGNKSEIAVGYCTLYGDMSGGLSVISDVPKTMVYQLAELINRHEEIIPRGIISKEPSAELRPNQKDSDSLPNYEVLDAILDAYLVEGDSINEIVDKLGYQLKDVEWTIRAVERSEYKRRQAAPGIKVSSKAFGMGRRMPIAAVYDYS